MVGTLKNKTALRDLKLQLAGIHGLTSLPQATSLKVKQEYVVAQTTTQNIGTFYWNEALWHRVLKEDAWQWVILCFVAIIILIMGWKLYLLKRRFSYVYLNIKTGSFNTVIKYCRLSDAARLYKIHTGPAVEFYITGNFLLGYLHVNHSEWHLTDQLTNDIIPLPPYIRLPFGQVNAFKRAFSDSSCLITPIFIRTHEYHAEPQLRSAVSQ